MSGRGYTFTRHNNKLTMDIDTEVFFDDKVKTANDDSRRKPNSPIPISQKQKLGLYKSWLVTVLLYICIVGLHCKGNLKRGMYSYNDYSYHTHTTALYKHMWLVTDAVAI